MKRSLLTAKLRKDQQQFMLNKALLLPKEEKEKAVAPSSEEIEAAKQQGKFQVVPIGKTTRKDSKYSTKKRLRL